MFYGKIQGKDTKKEPLPTPNWASTEALCAILLPSKEGRKSTFIPTLSVGDT